MYTGGFIVIQCLDQGDLSSLISKTVLFLRCHPGFPIKVTNETSDAQCFCHLVGKAKYLLTLLQGQSGMKKNCCDVEKINAKEDLW